jgi:hypothetical protein
MFAIMKIGVCDISETLQAHNSKEIIAVGNLPGIDLIHILFAMLPQMERMALDRRVIPLKEIGELQLRMRGNCQTSLAMYLIDHTRCVLVRIDGFLQIDTKNVVIFEKVTDLKTRYDQEIIRLFCPTGDLFELTKIGLYIPYRFSLLSESEAYGRLCIEEMVGDRDCIETGSSIYFDDIINPDRSVAECGMNVKVS